MLPIDKFIIEVLINRKREAFLKELPWMNLMEGTNESLVSLRMKQCVGIAIDINGLSPALAIRLRRLNKNYPVTTIYSVVLSRQERDDLQSTQMNDHPLSVKEELYASLGRSTQ